VTDGYVSIWVIKSQKRRHLSVLPAGLSGLPVKAVFAPYLNRTSWSASFKHDGGTVRHMLGGFSISADGLHFA
jgi:hypothetical protein